MKQRAPEKDTFFNRFTATKDRPLAFQVTVLILVAAILIVALATALLLL